jgi:hypothetical protein
MTAKRANALITGYNGYGKTDDDFTAMIHSLNAGGLSLMDGEVEYSPDMTNKHYFYRLAEDRYDNNGDWYEGKTVGWLSAYKCFVRGIDNLYEILAYVS